MAMKCKACDGPVEKYFNYCPHCGIQLKGNKPSGKDQKAAGVSPMVIFGIFIFVLLLGVGLLVFTGVFDTPAPQVAQQPAAQQPVQQQGADLSQINRINDLEAQVNANPGDLDALLKLAHLLNDSGFFERAIEKYKIYLNSRPGIPDVIIDMGVCNFNLKRYTVADSLMRSAVAIDPNHQIGYYNLGVVNASMGNMETAREFLLTAIAIDPDSRGATAAQELLESINQ